MTRRNFVLGALWAGPVMALQAPTSAGPADPKLIDDVVLANRILAQEGVLDAFGHVTARHNRNPNRFLMSRSLAPALITADDLIEYDLDGNAVNAKGRSEYSERFIHAEIYRARPDVNAVAHSHAPSIIPFGVSVVRLRPVYHMAGFITEDIPIFDIRKALMQNDRLQARLLSEKLNHCARPDWSYEEVVSYLAATARLLARFPNEETQRAR